MLLSSHHLCVHLLVDITQADEKKPNLLQTLGSKAAALSLATLLSVAPLAPALASEFDVLAEDEPKVCLS